ncbi:MAG: hypothetical protein M3373_04095 [Gemmatimonadota bacterium]|nr:hypothetical protein [Gemmatimonadota bacterium]
MRYSIPPLLAVLALAPVAATARAQDPAADSSGIFAAESALPLTLAGDLRALFRDRGDEHPWREATLTYPDSGGATASLPVRVRTRGLWRLRNCTVPPLRLRFAKEHVKGTPFEGQDRPKLVTHCRDAGEYEQYVVQEYLLYRAYSLLTPVGFRARLARVTYADSGRGKSSTHNAVLLEAPSQLARRNGLTVLEAKGARPDDLEPYQSALFGVFQYFIGNTDWSISGLHNVELVQGGGAVYPVPFDFDFSGAIATRYATPDPQIPIKSVVQRHYRGYCASQPQLEKVFALFNEKKEAIYALYRTPGPLDRRHEERALEYFDAFYRIINDPARVRRDMLWSCRKE